MADLGKMKVEEDITETHREVLLIISGWLGWDTVITWLSRKERGNLPKWQCLGTLHPCWRPSSVMVVFKMELITSSPCCPSIMCPLDLFPCDIPYSGVILHQKTACNSTSSYYVPVLCYTVSVLCGCQDEHPTHSIGTPTTLSVVEKMVSWMFNLVSAIIIMWWNLCDLRRKWPNLPEHPRKDIICGGHQIMSGIYKKTIMWKKDNSQHQGSLKPHLSQPLWKFWGEVTRGHSTF